jgi:hypothetical protein
MHKAIPSESDFDRGYKIILKNNLDIVILSKFIKLWYKVI